MTTEEKIAVMQAYKEGKIITVYPKKGVPFDWIFNEDPNWNWEKNDYVIKKESTFRLYNNAKEFLQAMNEHGPMLYDCRSKEYFSIFKVTDFSVNGYSFSDLEQFFRWQDGTHCWFLEKYDNKRKD